MSGAVRLGLARGWIETKHGWTSTQENVWRFAINAILIVVLILQRDSTVDGVSLASATLPSLIGMTIVTAGLMNAGMLLSTEREDGTLLRAKAVPGGMLALLVARLVLAFLTILTGLVIMLVAGSFILDGGFGDVDAGGWALLGAVTLVGLAATLPWGAIIGSLVRSSSAGFGLTFLPVIGLTTISGIFYPISGMPGWIQDLAQVFPLYWLGLGMRSALLPDSAAAAEIGESWRHWETFGVLGLWAVVGLVIAPGVLRRMARRESGSAVEERRQQFLQRVG